MKIIPSLDTGFVPSIEYGAKIKCANCGETYYIAVLRGVTVIEYLEKEYCPNCDCMELKPYEN